VNSCPDCNASGFTGFPCGPCERDYRLYAAFCARIHDHPFVPDRLEDIVGTGHWKDKLARKGSKRKKAPRRKCIIHRRFYPGAACARSARSTARRLHARLTATAKHATVRTNDRLSNPLRPRYLLREPGGGLPCNAFGLFSPLWYKVFPILMHGPGI
jgi:hypothetical protein